MLDHLRRMLLQLFNKNRFKSAKLNPRHGPSTKLRFESLEERKLLTAFTPGDLVVYREGTGSALSSAAAAVFLDEYTPSGTLIQSIAMPTSTSGSGSTPNALTASGTATSEGELNLSTNGQWLTLTGYDVAPGASNPSAVASSTDPRVVGVIGVSGSIDTTTKSTTIDSSNNIRGAVSTDGNSLWIAGADGSSGVYYTTLGSSSDTALFSSSTYKNARNVEIFNGQLYVTTDKYLSNINSVGSGEPTTTGQTPTGLPANIPTLSTNDPDSFYFANSTTLYVADDVAGITKYTLSAGTWTADKTIAGGTYAWSGLTGSVAGNGTVTLYATGTNSGSTSSEIVSIVDTSGTAWTTASAPNPTVVTTSTTNELIRGIAFTPDDGVGAITGLGTTTNYTQGLVAVNPASAAAFSDASNFDGGKLVASGGLASDTLGITSGANNIATSGSTVSYNGTQIGTFSGGSGTTALTITFNNVGGNVVTGAAIQSLIKQISFSSTTSSATGNRTLSFQVTENSGVTDTAATQTVNVAAPSTSAPTINALGSLNINPNAGQQTVNLSGIQHNGGTGSITVTATSDNSALVPNSGSSGGLAVSYTSPNSTGSFTFTPIAGVSGTAHITVTVTDSGGSATTTETVNVIAPPTNTVLGSQSVFKNIALPFSTSNNNAISIVDAAVGANSVQIAMSVSHGMLTLNGTTGLTFSSGSNGSASFTLSGSVANINTALNGLSYAPTANYTGSDTLQLVTNDLGHTASGIAQSTTSTVGLSVATAPLLNEIEANPPGTDDNRYEYVEISGTPGQSLNNDYFVAFDGQSGSTGNADLVVNLSGYSIGSDGLLVIQSASNAGHSIPAATTLVADPTFFTQAGGFNNGTLSFFLYNSPNTAFIAGTDYDTNDDGTLDHLPTAAIALDNVAILNTNNSSDKIYGSVDVTENPSLNTGTADAVTRFPGTTSTSSANWYGGELFDTGNVDSTINYDVTREASNEPANAYLTPGSVNYPIATAVVNVTSGDRVYNSSAYTPTFTIGGTYGLDNTATVSYTYYVGTGTSGTNLGSNAPKNVGTYTVIASFAGDATYGPATSNPVTFHITAAPLTVTGLSASNKTYDSTSNDTLTGTGSLVGVIGNDNVTLTGTATGTFDSSDVGSGINVEIFGLSLGGTAASNYSFNLPTLSANISAAPLTVTGITANNKTYDGTTVGTLNTSAATLQGVIGSDNVTLVTSAATGTFASASVGDGIIVTVSGLSLGGTAASDYSLTQPTGLTANIYSAASSGSLVVTTATDLATHTGTSLRDAITVANADAVNGASDTITFDPSLAGQTVTLVQGQLELGAGGTGSGVITIDGGSQITVSGNNNNRDFQIDANVSAALSALTITKGFNSGAAIFNSGSLTLSNSTISNNFANVGTIVNQGMLTVINTTISGNNSYEDGGIYNSNLGTLTVSDSTISSNSASIFGFGVGGIRNDGLASISNSAISNNTAPNGPPGTYFGGNLGGGILNSGTLTISNSTISNNSTAQGGGIFNVGTLTISNSTVANNSAVGPDGGICGGIENQSPAALTLINTIVAGNTATVSDPDMFAALTSFSSNNLIGIGTSNLSGISNGTNGNQIGTATSPINPLLGSLANNGGPTQTMALLSGSPAINAGGSITTVASGVTIPASGSFPLSDLSNPSAITAGTPGSYLMQIDSEQILLSSTDGVNFTATRGYNGTSATSHNAGAGVILPTDQRGFARVGAPDIGAFEFQDAAPVVAVGNTGNITFIRGSGTAVAVEPNLTVTDADDTNEHSATVTLSAIPDGTSEALAASTTGTSISASYNQVSGVLTLSGNDTLAHYQQVLRSVTYVDNLATTTNTSNRTLSIVVNDGTANSTTQTSTVAFDVAPTVTGAYVRGSAWTSNYMTLLGTIGSDSSTLGYALPSGTNQLAHSSEVTWVNADTISLTFSKPVSATLSSLTLLEGGASGNVTFSPTTVTAINSSNGMSNSWQWKFSTPLVLGKYDINLSATSVTDAAGANLDGDWTNSNGLGTGDVATNTPSTFATGSGNGSPGGAFNFVFYVLPGDVTTSGLTSGSTFNQAKIKAFQTDTSNNYRFDVAGVGTVTAADVNTIKLKVFKNIDSQPAVTIPNTPGASQALTPGALDAALADPSTISFATNVTPATL